MKLSEIRQLKPAEIVQEVENRKKELMELRFQNSVGQLANPARIRELKREVAQLLTVSTESKGK
ncbi:50S ribosomal protein L29 [Deinococcus misasensis]|uniref:50S ribosomal protein L29 n=1 Tax=Deinococcus misasensis TaxID=392413 RepID=UPI00054FEB2D|nr:50S ribosomal protein L29 [Deinococcus misasensis]